jgi:hypothetical protein
MTFNATPLDSARLARWSQDGEARLTPASAAEWLNGVGLARWLPADIRSTAPAPSFLEAVVGRPAPAPSSGERERAKDLLARTVENSSAAPLRLDPRTDEEPDWIVSTEALRFIYALRGNRNFKAAPTAPTAGSGNITPLAIDIWRMVDERGPQTAAAVQSAVGGDVSETAIARTLNDLWAGLYVFPSFKGRSEPAEWELFSKRFPGAVSAGSCTSHAEAQSALISLYLHAAVAATEEEILAFLSPLAPQSKLREVVRHLGSMRELRFLDIGNQVHLCLRAEELPLEASRQVRAEPERSGRVERKDMPEAVREERRDEREPFRRPQRRSPAGESYGDRARPPKFASERFERGSRPGGGGDRQRAYPPRPPARGRWRNEERQSRPYGQRSFQPKKWGKPESGKPEFGQRPSREGDFERGPRRDGFLDRRVGKPEFRGKPPRDWKFKSGKPGAGKIQRRGVDSAESSRPGGGRRAYEDRRAETGPRGKRESRGGRENERGWEDSQERDRKPFWSKNPRNQNANPRNRKAGSRKGSPGNSRGKRPRGGPPSRPRGNKK